MIQTNKATLGAIRLYEVSLRKPLKMCGVYNIPCTEVALKLELTEATIYYARNGATQQSY
jgi:hypothetical protein